MPLLQYVMWDESCRNLSWFTWNVGIQNQNTLLLPESIKYKNNSWYWFRGLRSSSKGRELRTLTIGELKQQRRQGIRKRPLKSEVALLQFLSRLFHLVQILFEKKFSWSWILKDCIKVQGKKGSRSLVFTSFTKREVRHFNVVFVQWR